MFFTLEKLERNTKQLKDLRYRERMEIPSFDASTPEEEPVGKRPESVVYTGTLKKGDFWIGRGTYLWIRERFHKKRSSDSYGSCTSGYRLEKAWF